LAKFGSIADIAQGRVERPPLSSLQAVGGQEAGDPMVREGPPLA
jgi:hypothetical protein